MKLSRYYDLRVLMEIREAVLEAITQVEKQLSGLGDDHTDLSVLVCGKDVLFPVGEQFGPIDEAAHAVVGEAILKQCLTYLYERRQDLENNIRELGVEIDDGLSSPGTGEDVTK